MPRHRETVDTQQQAEKLAELIRCETSAWKLERLHIIRLAIEGDLTLGQIAQARNVALRTVHNHLKLFREGGVEALLTRKSGKGPASHLKDDQRQALLEGLEKGTWTNARQIHRHLEKEHGLKVVRGSVYKYLAQLKAKLKVGRKSHRRKKPSEAKAFREGGLLEKLLALKIPPGRPVRLWVEDEARIGLHTNHRRVWTLRGREITVPTQQKYQWDYVYALLEVEGHGDGVVQFLETVSKPDTVNFLRELCERDPASTHVVLYDGAGFHPNDGDGLLPENVRIVKFPSYSPELNPAEGPWDMLRDDLANTVFETVEKLREAAAESLSWIWTQPKQVKGVTGFAWLVNLANATGVTVCAK